MDPFIAQLNLIFQIIILVIISASLMLKSKKKLILHGATMLMAVILNTVSVFFVMLPSLLRINYSFNIFSLVGLTHATLGVAVEALAIWLVASWRLQSSFQSCTRKRKLMRATSVLWLIVLLLGILIYVFLYTSLIP